MSLYTWNVRTGVLDEAAKGFGLELAGLALKPGARLSDAVQEFWDHYVYLVGVRQENDDLREKLKTMSAELAVLRERASEADRLGKLLMFSPPPEWVREGARVIAQRLGPSSALETVLIDKGEADGYDTNAPVLAPEGVVGRVLRSGRSLSTVLLITDLNSAVAVLGQESRSAGILMGGGPDAPLQVHYVPLNAPLIDGELLITSGVDGIFPKGLPVAKVTRVEASHVYTLFQEVEAAPLVEMKSLEEALLLRRPEPPRDDFGEAALPPKTSAKASDKPADRPQAAAARPQSSQAAVKPDARPDARTDAKPAAGAAAGTDRKPEARSDSRPGSSAGQKPDQKPDRKQTRKPEQTAGQTGAGQASAPKPRDGQ